MDERGEGSLEKPIRRSRSKGLFRKGELEDAAEKRPQRVGEKKSSKS